MATKQILFRLEETSAKTLSNKLTEKGISKQFLFSKVVDLFINNELSLDNNLLADGAHKQITIDSSEVAETIKKYYLDDLANLIASDKNLIALVTERLESNVLDKFDADNKSYQIDNKSNDNNVIAFDLEEVEEKAVIIPKKKKKVVTDDSRKAKSKEDADTVKSVGNTTHGGDTGNDMSKEKTFDDTIAKIKTLKSDDKTNGEIVKILNQDGYPTTLGSKGKWRSNQVQSILKRHQ